MSDEVRKLIASCDSRRVVVELTEQVKVDDYSRLSYTLRQLRLMGVRLAIDDTGAGFASLAHILKLTPDIIKLDRELTSRIDHDPVRSTLAAALVTFASRTGAEIVAEGIETGTELRCSVDWASVTGRDSSSAGRHQQTQFRASFPRSITSLCGSGILTFAALSQPASQVARRTLKDTVE
jgi:predicted signal transduction protein with EAL and GGDEF domain